MDAAFDQPTGVGTVFGRHNICTPSQVDGVDGAQLRSGKVKQLQHLCDRFRVHPAQVLFFDGTAWLLQLGRVRIAACCTPECVPVHNYCTFERLCV